MAVQIVNVYAFHVRRLSNNNPSGRNAGEQVYIAASSLANAQAVLQAQYGADLGTVTGGAALVPGALTTMTGT